MARARKTTDTADRILDVAERLVQMRGFNGFSYADVATELEITKAALHYHYPGKAELGSALVHRYTARFRAGLATLDALDDPVAQLTSYARLYLDVLLAQRMCLCGMLAAEYQTLPAPMQDAVIEFFQDNEAWLATVLDGGRRAGARQFAATPLETARMIVGALEGAMLVARVHNDPERFETFADQLLGSLVSNCGPRPVPSRQGAGTTRTGWDQRAGDRASRSDRKLKR
jgi:TetR/AcrR family transcriptional repressor of nem operon